ncbi:MAG: hypothetical protein ACRDIB_17520, partial [Ardenticatenaceae bacterium]
DYPALPDVSLPLDVLPPEQEVTLPIVLTSSEPYVPAVGEPLEIQVTWRQTGTRREMSETTTAIWPTLVQEIAVMAAPATTPPAGEWLLTLRGAYPEGRTFLVEKGITVAAAVPPPPHLLPVSVEEIEWVDEHTVVLTWRAHEALHRYYAMSARLLAPDGAIVAQRDGPPGGDIPTLLWQPGSPYTARWQFDLPRGASGDQHRLQLHWYDPEGGPPLYLWDGERFVAEIERS